MDDSYSYPIDTDWTQAEMIVVMNMWQALEDIYEKGMAAAVFLDHYQAFKTVVKSIGEERRLGKEFEAVSGYSLYHAVKTVKAQPKTVVKMKGA